MNTYDLRGLQRDLGNKIDRVNNSRLQIRKNVLDSLDEENPWKFIEGPEEREVLVRLAARHRELTRLSRIVEKVVSGEYGHRYLTDYAVKTRKSFYENVMFSQTNEKNFALFRATAEVLNLIEAYEAPEETRELDNTLPEKVE